jgi:hypothetical protein
MPPVRFEEATHRTTRWIDRCISAHARPREQNLFAICQVGFFINYSLLCEWAAGPESGHTACAGGSGPGAA